MSDNDQHTYQLLTKRPHQVIKFFEWKSKQHNILWQPKDNVWIGVSVENQEQTEKRIPLLAQIPAAAKFISCEPMLGPIDYSVIIHEGRKIYPMDFINWVICGGESGSKARPLNIEWARSLRDQCLAFKIPFFFKQWGHHLPLNRGLVKDYPLNKLHIDHDHRAVYAKVGKKEAGRILDGKEYNEFPKIQS